jgi:RsiW-degrading membrane proteinase PrsW (M82 family)
MFNILFWAAVIPPIFLMYKVYQMDRIEREPIGLLLRLFALGAVACFPAAIIEAFLEGKVLPVILDPQSILFALISNFIIIAGAEEGFKYLVLKKMTWRHPAFDHTFDAVVYSVAVTLGFAALENILYVSEGGLSVAMSRALLSIPGHCIFGIFMGYYYGLAKKCHIIGDLAGEKRFLAMAVIHPMLLHGFFDFCLTTGYDIMIIIFFVYVIILDVIAFRKIKKLAREDMML